MKRFLKLFRLIFIAHFYLIYCYFAWILRYAKHPEKYPLELRYRRARKLVLHVIKTSRADLKVNNMMDLDTEESRFFVCNHVSALDPLVLVCLSKKPIRFIAKKETLKLPFAGKVLKALGAWFLDREDPRQAIRIFQDVNQSLQKKEAHICIFPEGTRNRKPYEDDLLDFHPGSFKIPQRAKLAITPLVTFGSFSLMKTNTCHRNYLVQMSFLNEIDAATVKQKKTVELAEICRDIAQKEFLKQRQNDVEYYESKAYKHKPIKWWKELNLE